MIWYCKFVFFVHNLGLSYSAIFQNPNSVTVCGIWVAQEVSRFLDAIWKTFPRHTSEQFGLCREKKKKKKSCVVSLAGGWTDRLILLMLFWWCRLAIETVVIDSRILGLVLGRAISRWIMVRLDWFFVYCIEEVTLEEGGPVVCPRSSMKIAKKVTSPK